MVFCDCSRMSRIIVEVEPAPICPIPIARYDAPRIPKHTDNFGRQIAPQDIVQAKYVPWRLFPPPRGAVPFSEQTAEGFEIGIARSTNRSGCFPQTLTVDAALLGIALMPVRTVTESQEIAFADVLLLRRELAVRCRS